MGKLVDNTVLDAALNEVGTKVDTVVLCEGEPTSYANATTLKSGGGRKLGDAAVAGFTGPADGDVSGRKITADANAGISIDETGFADHVALVDDGAGVLSLVTKMAVDHSGTAQAGGASSITLAAAASANDDEYNGQTIEITGGTGAGQIRHITDYDGTSKVATVDSAWSTQPDATSTYEVYGQQVMAGNTADLAAFDQEIADPT